MYKATPLWTYSYAAYPGPAAYYGSQYGLPYNQYWSDNDATISNFKISLFKTKFQL